MTGVKKEKPLLEVLDLSLSFKKIKRGLHEEWQDTLNHVNIAISKGEVVAVVGASGSGKSLLANAILGLLPSNAYLSGKIFYYGEPLTGREQKKLRGKKITLIPQSIQSLDPRMKAGKQVRVAAHSKISKKSQRKLFERVKLPRASEKQYPFQLSGGMAKRVLIASSIARDPELIIADESTLGVDDYVASEVLSLLKQFAKKGKGVMFITHDIKAALTIAHKVVVLYAGTTVEVAPSSHFEGNGEKLRHPYTKALWQALPQNGFHPLQGEQPLLGQVKKGCSFASRCSWADDQCYEVTPSNKIYDEGQVRCFHA
ncbi:ABC transporter ATP-binding protein [Alteribacillus iranensis]|uniref:Nickel import system ATP-binding protein NikD n=1 Tax=Alteribacillus iranensis TaxID=930128 RepID=A0A1I2BDF6_9BACI|nr:ABC transporter ATP-binding protein [Alteribacillus iranensis]SFE54201.1 peptide/nickel transport system ATP-binding protein [Alteribacillus iranensis]